MQLFRGMAQPVPGMPQTPDAPGLHRKRLNGVYYIEDPAATPPDEPTTRPQQAGVGSGALRSNMSRPTTPQQQRQPPLST